MKLRVLGRFTLGIVGCSLNAWAGEPQAVATDARAAAPSEAVAARPADVVSAPAATTVAAPRFVKLLPERFDKDEIDIAVDQELTLAVVVEQAQGAPILMEALGLPAGATFDPELRSIKWRPSQGDRGIHQVRLRAASGGAETSRVLVFNVHPNYPPSIGNVWFDVTAGEQAEWPVDAVDPEGSPVVIKAHGLPKGATLDADGTLRFSPTLGHVGEHTFELSASDGTRTTTRTAHIRVHGPSEVDTELAEWTSFWLPGAGYSLYTPRDSAEGELFHGLTLEIVIAAWIHRNDNHGPSHGRVYINAELLNSDVKAAPLLFTYAAGLSLSFEHNPGRSWLVPYYGIDFGGMVHKNFGGLFQTTPHLGVHLFSNSNLFLGAHVGYRFVPSRIDTLAGLHASVTADVTVW